MPDSGKGRAGQGRSRPRTRPAVRAAPPAPGSQLVVQALDRQYAELEAVLQRLGTAPAADDVHRARVAARRLRSLLKTFARVLDRPAVRLLRLDLRSFAQAYGAVREADVRRELLLRLARDSSAVSPAEFRRLDAALTGAAAGARDALRERVEDPAWPALIRAMARQQRQPGLVPRADIAWPGLFALLERPWRKAMRLAASGPDDAAGLHELRLALKHCRYALEPVADLAPRPGARLMRRLRAVQDALGDHRDTLLALDWVEQESGRLGGRLSGTLRRAVEREERRLRRLAGRRVAGLQAPYDKWRGATRRLRRESTPGRS